MASRLVDPNNHVPEATPDDGRDDISDWDSSQQSDIATLPTKRKPLPKPIEHRREGIKIGSSLTLKSDRTLDARLEVKEHTREVVKLVPKILEVEKIPRLFTFHEKPQAKSLKSDAEEVGDWGNRKKQSIRWMLGTGIGVASVVILGLIALPFINQANKVQPLPGTRSLVLEANDLPVADLDSLDELLTHQSEAEQIFQKFVSAGISSDFLAFVRDADAVAPLIRKNPHSARVSKDWLVAGNCTWSVSEIDGMRCAFLEGKLPDSTKFRAGFVLDGKRLLLDWKATTGYGSATFAELAKNQGDSTEIRGWIFPTSFYTATFPETDFQCYQFLSPDKLANIWCYTAKNDPIYPTLARIFRHGAILRGANRPTSVTLKLEHSPAGALPNQWLIGKMLHKEWISP